MPETLFIADIHLYPDESSLLARFLDFLTYRACQAETLYILGDLFEAWIGDDDDAPTYQTVQAALRSVTARGLAVKVMRGNRDFLLGAEFERQSGCQLLPDSVVVEIYGTPVLLLHGDTLCTLDTQYQAFRQQVRQPSWQAQFLGLSRAQRRQLVQQARTESQVYTRTLSTAALEVTSAAVTAAVTSHSVPRLIHGHIHRPGVYESVIAGHTVCRYVVSDWQVPQVSVVSWTPRGCELVTV